jgi:hypothetical protein
MAWLLLSLLGLIIILFAIFYFVNQTKSLNNKALGSISFIFDFIFSFGSGAILFGLILIIIGIVKAGS